MDRKEVVRTLSEHLDTKPKYLGAPSFAYQVGEFTVDREGKIISKAGEEVELEDILNTDETTTIEIAFPLEDHSGRTLRNLVNMIYSRQVLIKKAFEIEENIIEEDFVRFLNLSDIETLEEFSNILEGIGMNKCRGILFDFEEGRITFNFAMEEVDSEKIKAFTEFLALLNKKSKELKYTSSKLIDTDNEKYAFRTWLMRLGMIGDEYKTTRKVLLQSLSGNGAFRKPGEKDEA